MATKKQSAKMDPFEKQVRNALKYINEPVELSKKTALAKPYFLGELLSEKDIQASSRDELCGNALQKLLLESLDEIKYSLPNGREYYRLLDTLYLQEKSPKETYSSLGMTRATFFNNQGRIIRQLVDIILKRSRPTLRLEIPPAKPDQLLADRSKKATDCLEQLRQDQSISIIGPSGVGKGVFSGYLASEWGQKHVLWYTVRPGLNDQAGTFLYTLGYFFQQHDINVLWRELVVDGGGEITPERLQNTIHYAIDDYKKKYQQTPLFCIDDIDLLNSAAFEEQKKIKALLGSIQGQMPLLYIGQRRWLASHHICRLPELSSENMSEILSQEQVNLSEPNQDKLYQSIQDNPQLLHLFIQLYRAEKSEKSENEIIDELSENPNISFLLERIMPRLDELEHEILESMLIFRRPIPYDAWSKKKEIKALNGLIEQGLVNMIGLTAVVLAPIYQDVLMRKMSPDMLEKLHRFAAEVRETHGEYTAAAYHYIEAKNVKQAIWLWDRYEQAEINQGQAAIALAMFKEISLSQLEEPDKQKLLLLRSDLEILMGNTDEAKKTLHQASWEEPSPFKLEKLEKEALIASTDGDYQGSVNLYQEALRLAEKLLPSRLTHIHKNVGWVALHRRGDMDAALREAQIARYEAENFQGTVHHELGNFKEARPHYITALQLAEKLGDFEKIAKICTNFSMFLSAQGEFQDAEIYLQQAEESYVTIEKTRAIAGTKINWAVFYIQSGQYDKAVAAGIEARDLFQRFHASSGINLANLAIAEAYIVLKQLDKAEVCIAAIQDQADNRTLPDTYWLLGRIWTQREQFEEAENSFKKSIELTQQAEDKLIEACAWRSWGEMYLKLPKPNIQEAREALQKSIDLFEEMNVPYEVEKTREILL